MAVPSDLGAVEHHMGTGHVHLGLQVSNPLDVAAGCVADGDAGLPHRINRVDHRRGDASGGTEQRAVDIEQHPTGHPSRGPQRVPTTGGEHGVHDPGRYPAVMSLADQITDDLKTAMKARDKERTAALRQILAGIKNLRVEEGRGGAEVTDEEVTTLLTREAKMRRESIETYTEAGREELAAKERAELDVINSYLPEQMGSDEIRTLVTEVVEATGANDPGDLGKVMGQLMPRVKGRADGKLVNQIVREELGG